MPDEVTLVVNIRFEEYDVYIGRAGHGESGYYGNCYRSGVKKQDIANFREHFYRRLESDLDYKLKVRKLKNKRLGCFCSPKACHGHVYADYLNLIPNTGRLAVVGSRTFEDYDMMVRVLDHFENTTQIISGGAKGADSLAKKYAQEHNIEIVEYLPDWENFGKSAGFRRNKLIIESADEIIAFWDGTSSGTKHSINLTRENSKIIYVVNFDSIHRDEISCLGV